MKHMVLAKWKGGSMRFTVVITYAPEYKGYVIDVPELVGCMSQGKTIDEALENIKDAIRGWLEVEKNMGDQTKRSSNLHPLEYVKIT